MDEWDTGFGAKSRLKLLLEHFAWIEDPRPQHRVAYPLREVLLLTVCATIADCDSYDAIGAWGERHLDFLRRFLPYHHGVPTGRWLTARVGRDRRENLAAQPRQGGRPAGAASGVGLRHDQGIAVALERV